MSADVTPQITEYLREASRLAVSATGNRVGNHALIVQTTVNPDGTFLMTWHRYYEDSPAHADGP